MLIHTHSYFWFLQNKKDLRTMKAGHWTLHICGALYSHATCYKLCAGSCRPRWSLPSSWLLCLIPLTSWEGQKTLPGSDIPHRPLLDGGGPVCFGLMWTLKQHHTAKTSQSRSSLWILVCGRTGSNGTGSAVAGGERKQEAEVNCWESEISTLNSAWQWYTKQPVCTDRLWRGQRLWPCQISQ